MTTIADVTDLKLPRVISKKELCIILDCTFSTGEPNYTRLREKFFPPYIITQKLELTLEEYRDNRTFDSIVTKKIYQALDITADEYHTAMKSK